MTDSGSIRASFEQSEALWDRFERTGNASDLDEAIAVIRQAVELTPPDEPDHPAALSNLGAALLRRGDRTGNASDLDEAIAVIRQAVELTPPDEPRRLAALSNLGDALRLRFEEASEPPDDDAVREFRQFGAEATTVYREVLELRERILGRDHPDTLAAMNNLAAVLQDQGDLSAAQSLHEQTYVSCQRVLGPDHPSTLATMNNLAAVLQDLGRHDEAQEMYVNVLRARERVLGPAHPSTLATMNNLAAVLQDLGRHDEALQLRSRIKAKRSLGVSQDAMVTVVGEQSESQLSSLAAWLSDDAKIGDRLRLAQPQPQPGAMGAMANALAVTLRSGVLTSFVQLLVQWLRSRKTDVRIVITNSHGDRVQLSAKNMHSQGEMELSELIDVLTDSLRTYDEISSEEEPQA
jgi:tetratricopeptide (TPR) repeat protein